MAELKTKPTERSVEEFLNSLPEENRRKECLAILKLMKDVTKKKPKMWGPSIVGFGEYHYHYESGREGDWFLTGFSPRKQNLTLYIMAGFAEYADLMRKLGKHKTGKSCLYINNFGDINLPVLRELIALSVAHMTAMNK